MKKKIYVRPLEGTDGWEIVKATIWESFWYSLFWHGPFVAIHNLLIELKVIIP